MKPGPIAPGWGTSSLRCFLVDAAGAMLEQRGSPHGVAPLRNLALGTHSKGAGVEDGRVVRAAVPAFPAGPPDAPGQRGAGAAKPPKRARRPVPFRHRRRPDHAGTGVCLMTASPLQPRFDAAFSSLPLVAILRGLTPAEAAPMAGALYEAGFRLIEVPLNSPQPFDSIATIRRLLPQDALVGAGTVLATADVGRLADLGAELVVMPHADTAVISAAARAGLICTPGVATPTEAFAALAAGAAALKIFPAELVGPGVIKAMLAVLPKGTRLLPVGGITPDTMTPFLEAGVAGFGLGSALFKPGMSVDDVAARARRFAQAWSALRPA
jgi:2-dehydro-3-deoxyphosphogalactonate aldolase